MNPLPPLISLTSYIVQPVYLSASFALSKRAAEILPKLTTFSFKSSCCILDIKGNETLSLNPPWGRVKEICKSQVTYYLNWISTTPFVRTLAWSTSSCKISRKVNKKILQTYSWIRMTDSHQHLKPILE